MATEEIHGFDQHIVKVITVESTGMQEITLTLTGKSWVLSEMIVEPAEDFNGNEAPFTTVVLTGLVGE